MANTSPGQYSWILSVTVQLLLYIVLMRRWSMCHHHLKYSATLFERRKGWTIRKSPRREYIRVRRKTLYERKGLSISGAYSFFFGGGLLGGGVVKCVGPLPAYGYIRPWENNTCHRRDLKALTPSVHLNFVAISKWSPRPLRNKFIHQSWQDPL